MQEIETRLTGALKELGGAVPAGKLAEIDWAEPAIAKRTETRRDATVTALCASRLGRDPARRRAICRRLSRLMLDHRGKRDQVFIVASGSAIDRWASRAAQIFRVPLLRVDFREKSIRGSSLKDEVLIHAADRVEAIYVRRRGAIARAIETRLSAGFDIQAKTHVCVTGLVDCDAARLIQLGAVGRWLASKDLDSGKRRSIESPKNSQIAVVRHAADRWFDQADDWLVHCTRAALDGGNRGLSKRWMDQHLVSSKDRSRCDTPLGSLRSIITSQRLIASAAASSHDHPVVCFSAVPLLELLSRRTFRSHLGRWDYEPFGIAIRRDAAESAGASPVVYGSKQDRDRLPSGQRFRFQASGTTYDWTAEREYRSASSVDLSQFAPRDVRVFVAGPADRSVIESLCPWAISVVSDILSDTDAKIPLETQP